jgi:hypothetical protein
MFSRLHHQHDLEVFHANSGEFGFAEQGLRRQR